MRRRFHLRPSQLLLLALLLALPGCASNYHEPSPAPNQVAFISATAPVWIARIDDRAVSRFGITGNKRFAILPGRHLIELQYSGGERRVVADELGQYHTVFVSHASTNNFYVPFTAEAGHNYFVHDGRMDNRWKPFVSESNAPVYLDFPKP